MNHAAYTQHHTYHTTQHTTYKIHNI